MNFNNFPDNQLTKFRSLHSEQKILPLFNIERPTAYRYSRLPERSGGMISSGPNKYRYTTAAHTVSLQAPLACSIFYMTYAKQITEPISSKHLKMVKERIAVNGYSISQLRDITCHMGSHSVTCHPTQVSCSTQNWCILHCLAQAAIFVLVACIMLRQCSKKLLIRVSCQAIPSPLNGLRYTIMSAESGGHSITSI